jgi:flagellar basal-body rod protein FlgG
MALTALHSAATGLSALNTRLDVIANNLANVNTEGFKGSRANFEDLLYQEKRQPGVENSLGAMKPTGLYVGLGVKVSGTQVNFTQGGLLNTERELDVAIEGNGFFQVEVPPDYAPNGIAYTRAGNFAINADGELVLANASGYRVEPGIAFPDDTIKVEITEDGRVLAFQPGAVDPAEVGQLELATFVNPAGLKQLGQNLFGETESSGPPITGNPTEENFGRLLQNFLEGSNVDPTRELIELIRTQRAYEMNSQSIRAADEALRTISQLGR